MKSRKIIWIASLALVLAVGLAVYLSALAQSEEAPLAQPEEAPGYQTIEPEEAARRLEAGGDGLIVDVRTQAEYDEEHISGAVLAPLDEIGSEPPASLPDLDRELYVHCRTGVRSRQAVEKLLALGYTKVYDLGGIVDWPYETVSTEEERAAAEEQAATAGKELPFLQSFTATDLDGNAVDQSLFADYRLTMINIWATYCGPCLSEMPELGKLSEAYGERDVQIVGIVSDAMNYDGSISDSQVELAREIVETTGADYRHLLPSEDLQNILLWQVSAVPTTIFVDSEGALVGYAYMGSADYDAWADRIEAALAEL